MLFMHISSAAFKIREKTTSQRLGMEMHSYQSNYRYLNHEYLNLLLPTRRLGDSQHLFVLLLVKYSKIYGQILMKLSGNDKGPMNIRF